MVYSCCHYATESLEKLGASMVFSNKLWNEDANFLKIFILDFKVLFLTLMSNYKVTLRAKPLFTN